MKRVLIFGHGDYCKEAFKDGAEYSNIEIVYCYNPEWDKAWSDPNSYIHPSDIKALSLSHKREVKKYEDLVDIAEAAQPDYGLVVGSRWLFKQDFFDCFKKGTLFSMHPAELPFYRGASPSTWEIMNGVDPTGVSIHELIEEVDAGDLLIQELSSVGDYKNPQTYSDTKIKLSAECVKKFLKSITPIGLNVDKVRQNHGKSSYFPPVRADQNGAINWRWLAEEIARFVDAFSRPHNGAWTRLNQTDEIIRIFNAEILWLEEECHPFCNGLIIRKEHGTIVVAVEGQCLRLYKDDIEGIAFEDIQLGARFYTTHSDIDHAKYFHPFLNSEGKHAV